MLIFTGVSSLGSAPGLEKTGANVQKTSGFFKAVVKNATFCIQLPS
jgi:hypothetical protein